MKKYTQQIALKKSRRASKQGVESVPSNATRREGSNASSKRSKTLANRPSCAAWCVSGDETVYMYKQNIHMVDLHL